MLPQREWVILKSSSSSGLFQPPKVLRATGTPVMPLRACQRMKSVGASFGDKTRLLGSTQLPAKPDLQCSPDEGLER